MADGYHPPLEEYLQTVFSLKEEGIPAIQARLAERLGRSAPSVSEMLDRLTEEGYVGRRGRVVELTPKGAALAEKVVRKHRLAERLLADVIGLEWHKVHQEAGRWEHVISDDVEARLIVLLGDPATCPHGNPIPGARGSARPAMQRPLADVVTGDRIRLERISEELELDMDSLEYLDTHRFVPGATATVASRAPDGTLLLDIDIDIDTDGVGAAGPAEPVAFGAHLAQRMFVSAQ